MNLVSYLMYFLPTILNASKNVTKLSWTASQCISWTSSQHCCHSPNWHCLPHTSFCVTLCYSCYLSKRSLCISYFQHFSLLWKCFTKASHTGVLQFDVTCFFLKAFLHVFIFLCVSRRLVRESALSYYHTGPGNLSRVTRLGGKSLDLQSHLWVLFCRPLSLLLSLLWVLSSRPLPRSAFIMLTSFLPSFSCSWASHLELTWVLNKCSFHIYFLCLTQVLAYGDKLIQFVIFLPQLPKCISLSCHWWLIVLYFSYSLWW